MRMPSNTPRQSTRALLLVAAATALQNAKDYHGASYDAALVEPRPSKACGGGLGVFAVTEVPPGARLAEIPVAACLTADAARAVLGGDEAESYAAQRELTRALLAYLRFGGTNETCAAQKAYVDSLPWDGVEDVKLKDAWRPTIMRIADRAGVADDDAARAVQLSRSRGLDLGTSAEDAERLHAMVPFLDLFNHPSLGALEASGARERVGKASVFDSCVKWYLSDDRTRVLVDAPSAFATPASQELWLWYGYDAKDHEAFVEAYGFEPFD